MKMDEERFCKEVEGLSDALLGWLDSQDVPPPIVVEALLQCSAVIIAHSIRAQKLDPKAQGVVGKRLQDHIAFVLSDLTGAQS
jgi:hypothetical protein